MDRAPAPVIPVAAVRVPRVRVDGVLLLDKPIGLSSNAALQCARRLVNAAKAGHTGTLDPMASGLLPLCFGEATKFAQSLLDARKEYLATVAFGCSTDTGDAEGSVTAQAPVAFTQDALAATLRTFVGVSQQVPPRFAALKFQGRNLYEYAREGVDVPRPARPVTIDLLDLVHYDAGAAVLRIGCSKGTYIRALAEDIAAALGTLAHLTALRRLGSGPFRVEDAITLDRLEAMPLETRIAALLPVDAPLAALPSITLDAAAAQSLLHGRAIENATAATGQLRAYDMAGHFLGLTDASDAGLRAIRLVDTTLLEQRSPAPAE